jgi:hypothetical protein
MKPIRGKKADRLKKKEERLVDKGKRLVDEGRDQRADKVLGRAAKAETRYHDYVDPLKKVRKKQTGK